MIYFIQSLNTVKVGYTSHDVKTRYNAIKTSNPHGMVLIGTMKGSRYIESEIHNLLEPFRVSGEWFKLCDEVKCLIDELLNGKTSVEKTIKTFRQYEPKNYEHGSSYWYEGTETVVSSEPIKMNDWLDYDNGTLQKIQDLTKEVSEINTQITQLALKKQHLDKQYLKRVKEL
jgi:hypothetical protein